MHGDTFDGVITCRPTAAPTTSPTSRPIDIYYSHDFSGNNGGFTFSEDLFYATSTNFQDSKGQIWHVTSTTTYGKSGTGGMKMKFTTYHTGIDTNIVSMGYTTDFTIPNVVVEDAILQFDYKVKWDDGFAIDDMGKVLVQVDGTTVAEIEDIRKGYLSKWKSASIYLGTLDGVTKATYSLKLGMYLEVNQNGIAGGDRFIVRFDNIQITGSKPLTA